MTKTAIVTDESFDGDEHNDALSAKDQGVDKETGEREDRAVDPRIAIMERIAAQNDEERRIRSGTRQEDMPAGEPVPEFEADDEVLESGLASQERIGDQEDESLPEEYADDPLAEFIEMDGDEPMFRTVVNGKVQLIPLEKARASIQKNMAADQRLREAAAFSQSLDDREKRIAAREKELEQRVRAMDTSATLPEKGAAPQSDEELTSAARSVVKELFTGTEDEAAAKLADLLLKNRGAAAVATSVDPHQIATQAIAYARQEITADARKKDVQKGYNKFCQDYPEIAEDDNLFALADGMTSKIEKEHPDWMPSEVMLEAGKRTREWVESQKTPTSEQDPALNDRTERKRNLKRVPRSRQGAEPKVETPEETPQSYLADLRKARGLPE